MPSSVTMRTMGLLPITAHLRSVIFIREFPLWTTNCAVQFLPGSNRHGAATLRRSARLERELQRVREPALRANRRRRFPLDDLADQRDAHRRARVGSDIREPIRNAAHHGG